MLSRLWVSTTLWIRHCRDPHFTVGSQQFRGKVLFQGHIMYVRKSHDSNSFECQCLSLYSQCILLPNINFSLIVKTLQKVVFSQFSNFPVSSLSIPSTLGYCFCKRWSLSLYCLPSHHINLWDLSKNIHLPKKTPQVSPLGINLSPVCSTCSLSQHQSNDLPALVVCTHVCVSHSCLKNRSRCLTLPTPCLSA